jgi:hypothetical protein
MKQIGTDQYDDIDLYYNDICGLEKVIIDLNDNQ